MTLRAIVVDDSLIFRKIVRDSLEAVGDVRVTDVAGDGVTALEKIRKIKPDLVTLDVEMPGLDGLQVLESLLKDRLPTKIIMVSSLTERGASSTTRALALGAFDFILKPSHSDPRDNIRDLQSQLAVRVKAISRMVGGGSSGSVKSTPTPAPTPTVATPSRQPTAAPELIAIGVSTGGPQALRQVLSQLPANLSAPVVVVQHMPAMFTASMAKDIDGVSQLRVVEATDGMLLRPGMVAIAPGGKQTRLSGCPGSFRVEVTDDPPVKACKPSVNYLLDSLLPLDPKRTLALIMTGMGDDGLDGCRSLRRAGATVWAQSGDTCTVYGMPRKIIEHGLADNVLPLDQIAAALGRVCQRAASPQPVLSPSLS